MIDKLTKTQQRAIQYWFEDGLAELSVALVCLLLAVLFLTWQVIFKTRWSQFLFFIILIAFSFGLRLVIQRIKERTTYLRTGYVSPVSGLENNRAVVIVIAFTILLLGVNFYLNWSEAKSMPWSSGVSGLIFAFIFTWTGYVTALRRFYFLGLFSLLVGVVLVLLEVPYLNGAAILAGMIGIILLCLGFRSRWAYTHSNPPLSR
jgi:uncharacterized membrane protein